MFPQKKYISVILPLKLRGFLTYGIPSNTQQPIQIGTWITVSVKGKLKLGVVSAIYTETPYGIDPEKIIDIDSVLERKPVRKCDIEFWKSIAEYYMCTIGEVFKAVYNSQMQKEILKGTSTRGVKRTSTKEKRADFEPVTLSKAQTEASKKIQEYFRNGKTVVLEGVTGSGKTEIYIHLAHNNLEKEKNVLYLVPEIAISKQLQTRLEKMFGDHLRVFHSKQTVARKREIIKEINEGKEKFVVLGTRSAIFLPFDNLGLIIIDEEHDHSYKQSEPAPRYNGRDAAMILAASRGANVLLGSATPSCESLYNVETGKFGKVSLNEKYFNNLEPVIKIIDTNTERRLDNMNGSFSRQLLKEIDKTVKQGEQVMVFRSRRAYSPFVQCSECGAIPKCPKCNVNLSFHKYNYSLSCHYCGYSTPFTTRCPECGETALTDKGSGTEKIEEELQTLFPDLNIARFDAETTTSRIAEDRILKEFASGKIDILVGTQMITKGFDFEKLSLVAVINADSLLAMDDFRCDERARQLLTQLLGRAGRREKRGEMIIQTAQKEHPALSSRTDASTMLAERKMFGYPPYVRLIRISVSDTQEGRLWNACRKIKEAIEISGIANSEGPVAPAIERINNRLIREFWIKLPREHNIATIKKALSSQIGLIEKLFNGAVLITVDVDPM